VRVWVQIISLIGMLIIGVFLGIDSAEKNMQKMQGTEGAPRAIQITPQQNGRIEIAVLGEVVEAKNPVHKVDGKKMKIVSESVKEGTNYLAVMGNQVGTGMRTLSRKVVDLIFGWVK
jgi:hypothetical protein